MAILGPNEVAGHLVELIRSDPRHLTSRAAGSAGPEGSEEAFGQIFFDALRKVNDLQHVAMDRQQQLITNPDSVDIHDVTVAIAEANLAVSTTKAVVDGAIRAYQGIVNVR